MNTILAGCLILISASSGLAQEVQVETGANQRQYLITAEECRYLWQAEFFKSGKGFGIRATQDCHRALEQQLPHYTLLLQKIAEDTQQLQGVQNFVLDTLPSHELFMSRLARALAASGQWDSKRGKFLGRAAKDANFMRDLMNQHRIFAEFSALFAKYNLRLTVADVEKLQIARHADGKFFPVHCSLIFTLTPL